MTPRIFLLAAALATTVLRAGDWPQWGGRNARNFVAQETGLPASFHPGRIDVTNSAKTLVPGENVKWTAPLGTQAYVTPAVAQGRVYIGANDANVDTGRFARTKGSVLDCLDEATGERLWRLVMPRLPMT